MLKSEAIKLASAEYDSATSKFPKFNSRHEGYAVLKKEVEELWDNIKADADNSLVLAEAKQVAAMGIRFLTDCCEVE